MKHSLLLLLLCIPFLSAFPQQIDGELYNLTKMKNGYRSKRISSYDKNGYNGDESRGIEHPTSTDSMIQRNVHDKEYREKR